MHNECCKRRSQLLQAMDVLHFVCAQHGHPIRYKDTENYWRVKVPYGQVAEGRH